MSRSLRSALGLALVTLAACSSSHDAITAPAAVMPFDANDVANEMMMPVMPTATLLGTSLSRPSLEGCGYVASSQSFVCPTRTTNGLTIDLRYVLLDQGGTPLAVADANRVAALRVISQTAGTLTSTYAGITATATIDDHQDLTLSGLLGATHTLDGTSASKVAVSAALPQLTTTSVTTAKRVVIPPSNGSVRWPLSGSVTTEIGYPNPITGTSAFGLRQTTTFNGTSKVAVDMTIGGGATQHCTIDLGSAAIALGLVCQ